MAESNNPWGHEKSRWFNEEKDKWMKPNPWESGGDSTKQAKQDSLRLQKVYYNRSRYDYLIINEENFRGFSKFVDLARKTTKFQEVEQTLRDQKPISLPYLLFIGLWSNFHPEKNTKVSFVSGVGFIGEDGRTTPIWGANSDIWKQFNWDDYRQNPKVLIVIKKEMLLQLRREIKRKNIDDVRIIAAQIITTITHEAWAHAKPEIEINPKSSAEEHRAWFGVGKDVIPDGSGTSIGFNLFEFYNPNSPASVTKKEAYELVDLHLLELIQLHNDAEAK